MTQLAIEFAPSFLRKTRICHTVYRDDMRTYSTAELIDCIIGSGGADVLASVNNCLFELGRRNVYDLMQIKGIGRRKALMIMAAFELGKRRRDEVEPIIRVIKRSEDTFALLSPLLSDLSYEEFWIVCLRRNNAVISVSRVSCGGVSVAIADPKIIFRLALEHRANSIVLCHNHPSGSIKPSESDVMLTNKLSQAGRLMDIRVNDHVIFAGNTYFSFADEGLM